MSDQSESEQTQVDSFFGKKSKKEHHRSPPPPPDGGSCEPVRQGPEPQAPSPSARTYDFTNSRRGKVLVFNHGEFKNMSPRDGSKLDGKNVCDAFTKLGFDVQMHINLTKSDILRTLKDVAIEDHSDADCLAVVVMSHGEERKLRAYDDLYDTSKLWESFKGDQCKTLVGKPKLFFIQACRGKDVDPGTRVGTRNFSTRMDSMPHISYVVPNMADIFVAYATFDGHYAFRSPTAGSWFIQKLCSELNERGDREEICRIMTNVNRRVAFEHVSNIPKDASKNNKKQIPNFFSSLTRDLYFYPKKNHSEN